MNGQSLVTLVFPVNPEFISVTWRPNPIRFRSPWTNQEQRIRRPGRWFLRYEWSLLSRLDHGVLMGLLNRYADESFKVYDVARSELYQITTGVRTIGEFDNLRINGVPTGRTLVMDGAPSSTLCVRAGDLIGMENTGECYEVSADATSSGGNLTVLINQYPRTAPADNERVVVAYAPIRVRLDSVVDVQSEGAPPYWGVVAEMGEDL